MIEIGLFSKNDEVNPTHHTVHTLSPTLSSAPRSSCWVGRPRTRCCPAGSACPGWAQWWGRSTTSVTTAATGTSAAWTSVRPTGVLTVGDLCQCSLTRTTMSDSRLEWVLSTKYHIRYYQTIQMVGVNVPDYIMIGIPTLIWFNVGMSLTGTLEM